MSILNRTKGSFLRQKPGQLLSEKDQGNPLRKSGNFSQERPGSLTLDRHLTETCSFPGENRVSPLRLRLELFLSEKEQGISFQSEIWVSWPRERISFLCSEEMWVVSLRKRPGLLPSETWATSPRERPGCLHSVRDPSTPSIKKKKKKKKKKQDVSTQTPERLLSEKGQGISPHTVSWETSPRNGQGFSACQRPKQLVPEKGQGVSPQSETWATSKKDQAVSPQSETWKTSPRVKLGHLPSVRDLRDFSQGRTRVSALRDLRDSFQKKRAGHLPSCRGLGDFSQRKTRASPLDRELGDFSQEWEKSHSPSET